VTTAHVTSADGTTLAVRRVGAGSPVVLLHGSGGGLDSWSAVAEELSGEHELWSVARRNHPPSDVVEAGNSFAAEVADVRAVLSAVGAPAHLVGASYGAVLALHAARADPTGLRSLALYEPSLFATGRHLVPVLAEYRRLLAAGDAVAANELFLRQVARMPAALLSALPAGDPPDPDESVGLLHDLEAMAGDDGGMQRWATVELPVLLMEGACTWSPVPETMTALADVLPQVERVVWEGQMHFATSTDPALVADTLRPFLRRMERAPS
jgi:pimeloyl-ACP methyl ester carboxylesterase